MNVPDYNQPNKNLGKESYISSHFPEFHDYLINNYPGELSFQERLYWYYNDLKEHPKCPMCGQPTAFRNFKQGYRTYCSYVCMQNAPEIKEKKRNTSMVHYGVDHPMKCNAVKFGWRQLDPTKVSLVIDFPNIDPELRWRVSDQDLHEEFFWYLDHPTGELTLRCNRNKIIKFFQQDGFFKKEKEMWKDPKIRQKILLNRLKYLDKSPEELDTYDILSGFKKSAIYYGYSGFNPQLCKWTYQWIQDNVGISMDSMIVYDPCGGWGHRMLGSTEVQKYIYNDLSRPTYEGVETIKNYFEFFNAELHNNDARTFVPSDDFNVMFTCPPYFNIESYECGDFQSRTDFDEFMNDLFKVFANKESCKVFAFVMREDLIDENQHLPTQKFLLSKNRSVHLNGETESKNQEYLYIYIK